jgi:xanthine dehydrogenase small subunit
MHQKVRFVLAGQVEELTCGDPTQTVLEYLREDKGLRGTKEGCAEGDCGACTVVVGELHGDGMRYQAVNSCIQLLPSLDGKQLITVEDLAVAPAIGQDKRLHVVQQAMVEQDGSQCGFCTPGFVMSLFALFHSNPDQAISREQTELGLAGNLCRCTGYAPIVRAAHQSLTAARSDHFTSQEAQHISQLRQIQPDSTLVYGEGKRRFHAPHSMQELCELLRESPKATMVAGATDVGLWVTKQLRQLDTVIYLTRVAELHELNEEDGHLAIGAAVTYTDASDVLCKHYPAFLALLERIGGAQVRNAGTIGGNIANGSPIGDMPPGLIALGAQLVLCSTDGQRVIELEDFFIDYGKQDLRKGECVQHVRLPLPPESQIFATYKISKRREQDISAVCAAFALQIENGHITNARVCFGGMAGTPKRASSCEKALKGQPWSQRSIEVGMLAMQDDFTPLNDMRASADYRMQVAKNLLQRFYLENSEQDYPVRLGVSHLE